MAQGAQLLDVKYDSGSGNLVAGGNTVSGGGGGGSTDLAIGTVTTTTVQVTSNTGADATIPAATNAAAGVATAAQIAKLEGIAAGATANSSDATLLNRTNHTGSQPSSTISDFQEAVEDLIGASIVQGTNVTVSYNDTTGKTTISASGSGSGDMLKSTYDPDGDGKVVSAVTADSISGGSVLTPTASGDLIVGQDLGGGSFAFQKRTRVQAQADLLLNKASLTFNVKATAVSNGDYTVHIAMPYACTVDSLTSQSNSGGTVTLAAKIDGTNITGLSAVSVTSTKTTTNATAANAVSIGSVISITLSSATALTDLSLSFNLTRT